MVALLTDQQRNSWLSGLKFWVLWILATAIVVGAGIILTHSYSQQKFILREQSVRRMGDAAFSPDGKILATAGGDDKNGQVTFWDVTSGRELRVLFDGPGDQGNVAFSSDGKLLVSGSSYFSSDCSIRRWDVHTAEQLKTIHACAWDLALSPEGNLLATGGGDDNLEGALTLWDVTSGSKLRTFDGVAGLIYSVAFSPDGRLLAAGGYGGNLQLWNVATGKLLRTLSSLRYDSWVDSIVFSSDGTLLISSAGSQSDSPTINMWSIESGDEVATMNVPKLVDAIAVSPDGTLLAVGGYGLHDKYPQIYLFSFATRKLITTFKGHTDYLNSLEFSPDGLLLASAAEDGTARIWAVGNRP